MAICLLIPNSCKLQVSSNNHQARIQVHASQPKCQAHMVRLVHRCAGIHAEPGLLFVAGGVLTRGLSRRTASTPSRLKPGCERYRANQREPEGTRGNQGEGGNKARKKLSTIEHYIVAETCFNLVRQYSQIFKQCEQINQNKW